MSNRNTVRYPKAAAAAELARKQHHSEKDVMELKPKEMVFKKLEEDSIKKLARTQFDLSGAHPYLFDALAYICTYHKQISEDIGRNIIELADDTKSFYFRVSLTYEDLLDFALDGHTEQEHHFLSELIDLMNNPKGKCIPISPTQSVSTIPLIVTIFHDSGVRLTSGELQKLQNLPGSKMPIRGVQVQFFKPLFSQLLGASFGASWFPLPKAFHAKLKYCARLNSNNSNFTKYKVSGYATTYRRYFLYLCQQDNSTGGKFLLDGIDLWEHINPREVDNKNGRKYLKRWKMARTWLQKANVLFNLMAKQGLLTGAKFAPKGVWYEEPIKQYTVYVQRKDFDNIPELEDTSPIKALPHYIDVESTSDDNII